MVLAIASAAMADWVATLAGGTGVLADGHPLTIRLSGAADRIVALKRDE
jgi:X-X-X-Leu-X-X-Gly heptad repeat protein